MSLKTLLQKTALQSSFGKTKEEIAENNVKIECAAFNKYYQKQNDCDKNEKSGTIPKFYFKLPREHEKLAIKLREESRAMFLQRRNRELLGSNELNSLWILLDKHHSPPYYSDEQFINYQDFLKVASLAG